jgi:GTPase SAR1 family protein
MPTPNTGGISPNLLAKLRQTLAECCAATLFATDHNLRVFFLDKRLSAYKDNLPQATSLTERIEFLIEYLHNRNHNGKFVLVTFLEAVQERQPSGDNYAHSLSELTKKVELELISNTSPVASTTTTPTISGCPKPPAPPDYFGGRDVPLAELTARLKTGQTTAIVAVAGLGGIGKTTLAKKLANDLYNQKMFKAILWADIGREPQSAQTILENWAISYADDKYQAGDKPLAVIISQVKSLLEGVIAAQCEDRPPLSRTLVVLDDVWDNGLEVVRSIKQACPSNSTVLITSRNHNVATNLDATIQNLDKLAPLEAANLLKQYLPTISDTTLLQKLGVALGGHPLALTLAARRIKKAENPDKTRVIKEHLAEYQQKLPTGIEFRQLKLDQAQGREDNLTLVLSYSYAGLAEADKARFRALGVLAYDQPFDKGILAALWDLGGVEHSIDHVPCGQC